jgi:hypothetical protein
MSRVQLRWSEAEVRDGRLCVPLEPRPEKDWARRFKGTAALLDRGSFGEVELKRGQVRVGPLEPGVEERLRHFLESVVLEANAPEAERERKAGSSGEDDQAEETDEQGEDPGAARDREMTERFRAYESVAGPEEERASEERG